LDNLQHLHA